MFGGHTVTKSFFVVQFQNKRTLQNKLKCSFSLSKWRRYLLPSLLWRQILSNSRLSVFIIKFAGRASSILHRTGGGFSFACANTETGQVINKVKKKKKHSSETWKALNGGSSQRLLLWAKPARSIRCCEVRRTPWNCRRLLFLKSSFLILLRTLGKMRYNFPLQYLDLWPPMSLSWLFTARWGEGNCSLAIFKDFSCHRVACHLWGL